MNKKYFLLSAAVVVFSATFSQADVTIKTIQKSGGFKGFGSYEGTTEHSLQGLKRWDSNQIKYDSKLMQFGAGKGEQTHITRVDLGLLWNINAKKKTYTETPIQLPKGKAEKEKPTSAEQPTEPESKPTHRIKKTDINFLNTGEKKTINNFHCEHQKLMLLVEVEEIKTGEVATFNLLGDFWMTPLTADLKKAQEEEVKFARAYMEKLGLTISPDDKKVFDDRSIAMLLGVGGEKTRETLATLKKKLGNLQGYPILTETTWTLQEDPKAVARRKEEQAKAQKEDTSPELTTDPKSMAGNLLGSFAKKKFQQYQEQKEKERELKPLLSTYSEVQTINTKAVTSSLFDIPAGYKKTN